MIFLKTKHLYPVTAIFAAWAVLFLPKCSFADEQNVENTTVENLTIPDGVTVDVLNINSAGVTINTFVGENGTMNINEQGNAEKAFVSGGVVNITQGGIASETNITNTGTLNIESGGQAQTINVADTGTVNINGETVIGAIIDGQGSLTISQGGTIQNIEIGSQASLTDNGTADVYDLKLNDGAKFNLTTDATIIGITNGNDETLNASIKDSIASGFSVNTDSILTAVNGGSIQNSSIVGGTIIVDNGTAQNINISSNGNLQISANRNASNISVENGQISVDEGMIQSANIQNGGIMNVEIDSSASNTFLNNGGQLNIKTRAFLNLVTVNGGGIINAETASTIYNLVANAEAVLKLNDGVILADSLTIHITTNTTDSDLNFENLFAEGSALNTLTLMGGVNSAFNKKVINNDMVTDKTLNLNNGSFVISDSENDDTVQIAGWNQVNVTDSILRIESDLALNGSEKNLSINSGSTLDVSETLNNMLNITLNGNIINKGIIDMSSDTHIVGDTFTIEGTYGGNNSAIIMDIEKKYC